MTGGLGFAGGPANNYPTHAIARMVEACRADPSSVGLVHALGWYATKHSVGVYSSDPSPRGYARVDPVVTQAEVDALPSREVADAPPGDATIEATSVVFERDGSPAFAVASLLTEAGARALATTRDEALMHEMTREPFEGRRARVTSDGESNRLLVSE